MISQKYQIQLLSKHHDKHSFSCGVAELDQYLSQRAGQDKRRCVAATYVLTDNGSEQAIIGYYTLSATSIELTELSEQVAKKLPRYPLIAATLLGRLAVDKNYHGNGYGELLLADALKRSLKISDSVASFSVIAEAKNNNVSKFYEKYGFVQFPDHKQRLFLPMITIKQAFKHGK